MKMGGLGLFLIGPQDKAMSNIAHKSVALYSPDYLRSILPPDSQTLNTLLPLAKYSLELGDNSDEAINFMYTSNCYTSP